MASGTSSLSDLFSLYAIAAVILVGGYFAVIAVRRWTRTEDSYQVFTLQDLREMQARGEITPAEFTKMRAAMLGKYADKTAAETPAPEDPEDDSSAERNS